MKKVLLSIAALFTVATYASAQETGFGFGPKVGINLSNQTLLDGDYKTGLTAGVFADYRFSNLFALSADVLYSRQGSKIENSDIKLRTDYLNIPVLARSALIILVTFSGAVASFENPAMTIGICLLPTPAISIFNTSCPAA